MSLSAQVFAGLGLGLVAGLFFGELIAPVGVVGQAFIRLLQMTVLPYVAISLVRGLGDLSAAMALSLARQAGLFLALLWAIALLAVLATPLAFPDWTSASFFSTNLVEERAPFDFLELFIPANPFESLAENVVPAVVVFSTALGIALIGVEGKESLLRGLHTLGEALGRITGFIVRLAPIGVFAIAAQAAGVLDPEEISGLQVYVAAYAAVSLLLSLWVLPGLVAALTPFTYREVMGLARDALVTAFATGNVFVVLSVLAEKSKELVRLHTDDAEAAESLVDVVVPTSYTFPSAGKLLTLAFVPFAGWLSGYGLSAAELPAFAVSGLFTFFGNTYVAVPFLLDMFRIPADTFRLFIVVDNVVGNRFGSLLAAVHTLVLALLAACGVGGLIRFDGLRLGRYLALTLLLGGATLLGLRATFEALGHEYQKYQAFVEMQLLDEPVRTAVLDGPPGFVPPVNRGIPALDRIRARGLLRVGYQVDRLPFTFVNESNQLVGFDVELMNALAHELDVALEFVKVEPEDVPRLLEAGYLDLAAGAPVTTDLMTRVALPTPHLDLTLAFLVADHRRSEFRSREALAARESLRLGVPNLPYYVEKIRSFAPQAEIVSIQSPRPFLRGQQPELDAIVWSAEGGAAWSLVYPEFSVVVPQPDVLRIPVAFPVARGEEEMIDFLSGWIDLKRKDGTLERAFDHWVQGRDPNPTRRRWSVIRDVLGWVD